MRPPSTPRAIVGGLALLAAAAACSAPGRESGPAVADGGRPQLLAICDAVTPRGGGACGAPRREAAAAEPMSRAAAPAGGDAAPPVRPIDAWGNAVRISVDGGVITLLSAGPDGEFGNGDDVGERCPG